MSNFLRVRYEGSVFAYRWRPGTKISEVCQWLSIHLNVPASRIQLYSDYYTYNSDDFITEVEHELSAVILSRHWFWCC
jgi:hypothetical protein